MKQGSFKNIHRLADTVMNFNQLRHLLLTMAFFFFEREGERERARQQGVLGYCL